MNVFLILPKINSGCQWNVGLAFISSVLKNAGHKIDLFEISDYPKDINALLEKIRKFKPGLVGITANSHQFFYAKEIAKDIKKSFSAPIFVGGVHTILKPESLKESEYIDGVCVGEGEFSFLKLVNRMENGKDYFDIKNFWFKRRGEIVKNKREPLNNDLNVLPFPDRSIFGYFSVPGKKTPRFIFSRGCPFECSYCCNHAFKNIFKESGSYVRWRSVDLAISEIEKEKKEYDFDYFKLDDDTFSLNKIWMREFCKKLKEKKLGLGFECNIRPGTVNEEDMKFLKEAGCKMIKIGIEAGDVNQRKLILNRNFSNEDIIKTFDLAKKFGIKTFSFNIIGVPGETRKTIKATLDLNRMIRPDFMQVTAFYPYPMTLLGDLCFEKGYVGRDFEDSYMKKSILKLPTISSKEVEKAVKNFKFDVYWSYDKKKALKEKILQMKMFIINNSPLHFAAKVAYKPVKMIKNFAK